MLPDPLRTPSLSPSSSSEPPSPLTPSPPRPPSPKKKEKKKIDTRVDAIMNICRRPSASHTSQHVRLSALDGLNVATLRRTSTGRRVNDNDVDYVYLMQDGGGWMDHIKQHTTEKTNQPQPGNPKTNCITRVVIYFAILFIYPGCGCGYVIRRVDTDTHACDGVRAGAAL